METSHYKYKAFISYRHIPFDMAVADKLQRLLETYKPPASSGIRHNERWRLFRDETELPTSSDLGHDIYQALDKSEYLICICSENYNNDSKWCMAELKYFKAQHGGSMQHIIPVLISGKPETSFPAILKYDEVLQQEVEPLAANITASTTKESLQRLRTTEFLRVAAQMLHCEYDELYQREKRRLRKRNLLIRSAVGGSLVLIAGISIAYGLSISRKNTELENKQIMIENQNQNLLIENARHLSVESTRLFQDGDYISAIQTALEALPSADDPKPVIPEAENTLSSELFAFEQNSFVPRKALIHDTAVEEIICTDQGRIAVTRDYYSVYVWETATGNLLKKYPISDFQRTADMSFAQERIAFYHPSEYLIEETDIMDCSAYLYDDVPGLGRVRKASSKIRREQYTAVPDPVFIYNGYGDVWKLSEQTGEILWENRAETQMPFTCVSPLFCTDKILRVIELKGSPAAQYAAEFIDLKTGNLQKRLAFEPEEAKSIHFSPRCFDGSVLTGLSHYPDTFCAMAMKEENGVFRTFRTILPDPGVFLEGDVRRIGDHYYMLSWEGTNHHTVQLKQYDASLQNLLWQTTLSDNSSETHARLILFTGTESRQYADILVALLDSEISLIDVETGNIMLHYSLNSEISTWYYSKRGRLFLVDRSQHEYAICVDTIFSDSPYVKKDVFEIHHFVTGTDLCGYCNDTYVTAGHGDNTAYVYAEEKNQDFEKTDLHAVIPLSDDTGFTIECADVNPSASCIAIGYSLLIEKNYQDEYFCLIDRASGKQIKTPYDKGWRIMQARFMTDNKLLLSLYPEGDYHPRMCLYDIEQQKEIALADTSRDFYTPWYISPDGTFAVFWNTNSQESLAVNRDGTITAAPDLGKKTSFTLSGTQDTYAYSPFAPEFAGIMTDADALSPEKCDQLMVCQFEKQRYLCISLDEIQADVRSVQHLFYCNDEQLCAVLSDGIIACFSTTDGKLLWKTDTAGIPAAVKACAPLNSSEFLLLGNDLCLYRMTKDGYTGIKLPLASQTEDADANRFENKCRLSVRALPGEHAVLIVLQTQYQEETDTWIVDLDTFAIRYHMSRAFLQYCVKDRRLYALPEQRKTIGSFPIYDADRLIEKAHDYLDQLHS